MIEEEIPQVIKKHLRAKIWKYMIENELVTYLPLYRRMKLLPNFKDAVLAAQRLVELDEFKNAKVIKINPDRPQEPVRFLALEANKEIVVPIPALKSGLFLHITPTDGATPEELKTLSTMVWNLQDLKQVGKPLGIDSKIKIDLVILGSLCVANDGHRIDKREGFTNLEFAMLMKMGAITEDTTIVTTVHDCQIVDDLPEKIFKEIDVPVDIIVTPTQTIRVKPRLKRPTGIIWEMLSLHKLQTMQVLQQLKEMEEKDGKVITLKEEPTKYPKSKKRSVKNKRRKKKDESETKDSMDEINKGDHASKPRVSKKRSNKKQKDGTGDNHNEASAKVESNNKSIPHKHKPKTKSQIEFSLKLSNISSNARVRDLKNALFERGVKPSEIVWKGQRGICYLNFSKLRNENSLPDQPIQVDSIVANLQQLSIGESVDRMNDFIIVEPAQPISRFEVTDVTAV